MPNELTETDDIKAKCSELSQYGIDSSGIHAVTAERGGPLEGLERSGVNIERFSDLVYDLHTQVPRVLESLTAKLEGERARLRSIVETVECDPSSRSAAVFKMNVLTAIDAKDTNAK